jgi:multiple antibiotic resistance protein
MRRCDGSFAAWGSRVPRGFGVCVLVALPVLAVSATAAMAATWQDGELRPDLSPRKIFAMLFLMLGPLKVLGPFLDLTRGRERPVQIKMATVAIVYSAAALLLAGALGKQILDNFGISVPVVAMTGGMILVLMALQTVLAQSTGPQPKPPPPDLPVRRIAINPLAFPVIVTPYGIAAVIVFTTLAQGDSQLILTIAGVIAAILFMDWLAMIYAGPILKWIGTSLQIAAVVLGVAQIALGLQVILHSLAMLGVLRLGPG